MNLEIPEILMGSLSTNHVLLKAIRASAPAHPSISGLPTKIRTAKALQITITAASMMDFERICDDQIPSFSTQLVDDAALALHFQTDRAFEIILFPQHDPILEGLVRKLSAGGVVTHLGLISEKSLNRLQAGLQRTFRCRLHEHPMRREIRLAIVQPAIRTILDTTQNRGILFSQMSDGEVLTLTDDAFDAVFPEVEATLTAG